MLAMKVRCYEYNWACAQMKKNTPKFSNPRFNAWRLVPDANIQYSEKAAATAREAQALLRRVIEDHPTTPWALLAERELKDPLGFKWVETYVQPRPRGNNIEAEPQPQEQGPRICAVSLLSSPSYNQAVRPTANPRSWRRSQFVIDGDSQ